MWISEVANKSSFSKMTSGNKPKQSCQSVWCSAHNSECWQVSLGSASSTRKCSCTEEGALQALEPPSVENKVVFVTKYRRILLWSESKAQLYLFLGNVLFFVFFFFRFFLLDVFRWALFLVVISTIIVFQTGLDRNIIRHAGTSYFRWLTSIPVLLLLS